MRFEWDEKKRIANIKKHGFDFFDAQHIFDSPVVTVVDDRFDYGEARSITFGLLFGRTVALAHSERDGVIRVISLRKASKNEQKRYISEVANRLEEDRRHDR